MKIDKNKIKKKFLNMKSKNLIDIFVKKKIKDKKIKIKISNKTDLFINSIFDS